MSLLDLKITEFDKKISELATRPNATSGMTDAEIKAWWDSSPEELRVKLNSLIDALISITAASQIGIDSAFGSNIKQVLDYIISQGSGSIPGDNSVGTGAIQNGAITLPKLAFDISTQAELDSAISNLGGTGRTTETIKGVNDSLNTHKNDNDVHLGIMTTQGDMIYRGSTKATRLPKGNAYESLNMNPAGSSQQWMASIQSLLTNRGDILTASGANTPVKLALGTAKKALISNGMDVVYGYPAESYYVASNNVILTSNAENNSSGTYSAVKTFHLDRKGSVRVKGQFKSAATTAYVRIYNQTTATVIAGPDSTNSTTYVNFSLDTSQFNAGDIIEIQISGASSGSPTVYIQNVTVCADETAYTNSIT